MTIGGIVVNVEDGYEHLRRHRPWCNGKVPYASRGAAEAAIRSVLKRGLHRDDTIHPYKCPTCLRWHFGHERGKAA